MSSVNDFVIEDGVLIEYYGGDTDVVIPNSVTKIIPGAFGEWSNVRSIRIPASVTSIEAESFEVCEKLESITVEEGNPVYHSANNCVIETKNKILIAGCQNSVIPSDGSVTSIGEGAFCICPGLSSIIIPEGVTSIQYAAFLNCNLDGIVLPNTLTEIGARAFEDCRFFNIVIPESVISIGEDAFTRFDHELYPLVMVASKGSYAAKYAENNGIELVHDIFEIEGKRLLTYFGVDEEIEIPDHVTVIEDAAFYNNSFLGSVKIPDSVTSIGEYAFELCSNLRYVRIPSSVITIGEKAFARCPNLCIIAPVDSAAAKYAEENGIKLAFI